jgi:hypothetical protein
MWQCMQGSACFPGGHTEYCCCSVLWAWTWRSYATCHVAGDCCWHLVRVPSARRHPNQPYPVGIPFPRIFQSILANNHCWHCLKLSDAHLHPCVLDQRHCALCPAEAVSLAVHLLSPASHPPSRYPPTMHPPTCGSAGCSGLAAVSMRLHNNTRQMAVGSMNTIMVWVPCLYSHSLLVLLGVGCGCCVLAVWTGASPHLCMQLSCRVSGGHVATMLAGHAGST